MSSDQENPCPQPQLPLSRYVPWIEKDFTLEEKRFNRFARRLCETERRPQYIPTGTWRVRDRLREMEKSLNEEKI